MNRWRVGEDRGSKETDGCPLTSLSFSLLYYKDKEPLEKAPKNIVLYKTIYFFYLSPCCSSLM
jgi:hypothetical protein